MRFDRDTFFSEVRQSLFGGKLEQIHVDGQNVILAVWEYQIESEDVRWLSYMLATTYHETAYRMWPITENGSPDYLQGKSYWPYVGRGYVQLTWEDNYRRASDELKLTDERDLVDFPDLALDSLIAARVLFMGMNRGWFTGVALADYFNEGTDDPVNARRIINGTDKADLIASYHYDFLEALNKALLPDVVVV
jgi:putative chitinase